MKILAADHVLPISSEAIHRAGVVVDGETIKAVDKLEVLLGNFPGAAVEDFGEAAILPGFVNCHSHLEITAMRGALDAFEHDFAQWLITLTKLRGEILVHDDIEIAALAGALEGARAGVTFFADIGRMGSAGLTALKSTGLRGVVYQETEFSAEARNADMDFAKLQEKFLALKSCSSELVTIGISPHAPYTVSRQLFEKIAAYALEADIKLTIHAAESLEEDELMRSGTGFFTSVYEKFGVHWKSPLCSSIEFLERTGILQTTPLLAHCVTVSDNDIDIIAASGSTVAHCPKSNAKFGHGTAPLEKLMGAGIAVGLGSDSVASNNSCDILEEGRFAALSARNRSDRKRFISPQEVLHAATLGGARAVGMSGQIGSLDPGKQADLTVIALDNVAQQPISDVFAAIVFSSVARDVRMTLVAGREIYRDGKVIGVDVPRVKARLIEIGQKLRTALN